MADAGTRAADKAQAEMERKMRRIYRQAQLEIIEKLNAHTQRMYALDAQKRADVESGKITPQQYKSWLIGQQFTQRQWKDKVDSVATTLLYANQQANAIVEGEKRAVFGENATYAAYEMEHGMGRDLSFSVYDSATVTKLLREDPELLPRRVVNGQKDKAWNRQKISAAVTQGIIQGESIPQIAKRIAKQTASSNMTAMTRYARTAMTSAQNAGRMEAMHHAQEMGIKVQKKWLATLDNRTRDAHAMLDGQVQDVDKPFQSELGPIMFPGDPSADPGNVYNCRCALQWIYPEYVPKTAGQRRDNISGELISDMTYKEWKSLKKAGEMPAGENEKEPTLEDLFADLWSGDGTGDEADGIKEVISPHTLLKDAELEKPGRYGKPETEYPERLQLDDYDKKRLDAIEHYYDDNFKEPKDMAAIRDDEVRLAKGDTSMFDPQFLEADRKRQKDRLNAAKMEIADKKASGYKGMSKKESAEKWSMIKKELAAADETEKGSILSSAAVGQSGIQYWQHDAKSAERELKRLDFLEKLYKRLLYARSE